MKKIFYLFALASIIISCGTKNTKSTVVDNDDFDNIEFSSDSISFFDENGYRYAYLGDKDNLTVELISGGKYKGTVKLPKTVDFDGKTYSVLGIGKNAFVDNKNVTAVEIDHATQYVKMGAYMGSAIQLKDSVLPVLVSNEHLYSWQTEKTKAFNPEAIFAPVGYDEYDLKSITQYWMICDTLAFRVHYERYYDWGDCSNSTREFMDSGEVFAMNDNSDANYLIENERLANLIADNNYVATHEFVFYDILTEKVSNDIKLEIEEKFNRKVENSYQVLKLKNKNAQLVLLEFEKDIEKGEAMLVYAWIVNDQITATYTQTAEFDINGYYIENGKKHYTSVWRVDDNGEYNCPDILSCAIDDNDNIDIFMSINGPEGISCSVMRIKDGKIKVVYRPSWYRRFC